MSDLHSAILELRISVLLRIARRLRVDGDDAAIRTLAAGLQDAEVMAELRKGSRAMTWLLGLFGRRT